LVKFASLVNVVSTSLKFPDQFEVQRLQRLERLLQGQVFG